MKARSHSEHERINALGTRQLCIKCGESTERCEEDSLYISCMCIRKHTVGPFCPNCYDKYMGDSDE